MDAFIGTILPWPANFAPSGWAFCDGSLLQVNQYAALFSVIGNTYVGGNGTTTFALPDLRCRIPLGMNNSSNPPAGLTVHPLGANVGAETETLSLANLPSHTHVATFTGTGGGGAGSASVTLQASSSPGNTASPHGSYLANATDTGGGGDLYENFVASPAAGTLSNVAGLTITGTSGGITGGTVTNALTGIGLPVAIMPPLLVLNYIIATQGIYPTRG